MTKEEKFEMIEALKPKLVRMQKSGTVSFEIDEKKNLQKVFISIYGQVNMDMNCGSCIRFYLEQLDAWYTREYPKHQQSIKETERVEAIEPTEVIEITQEINEKPKKEKQKAVRKTKAAKTNSKNSK